MELLTLGVGMGMVAPRPAPTGETCAVRAVLAGDGGADSCSGGGGADSLVGGSPAASGCETVVGVP